MQFPIFPELVVELFGNHYLNPVTVVGRVRVVDVHFC